MKTNQRAHTFPARILAIILALAMLLALCACGQPKTDAPAPTDAPMTQPSTPQQIEPPAATPDPTSEPAPEPEDEDTGEYTLNVSGAGQLGLSVQPEDMNAGSDVSSDDDSDMPRQLTIEDVQAMNDSTIIDIYTNKGYLSTLVGKFYDKPVRNAEDGVESIKGMASLLGLTKGCDFFIVYSECDNDGYTYYTYQQRYGGYSLQYATLRIVVDPDGYTAGLTSSFVPNAGTSADTAAISKEEAEVIVRKAQEEYDLRYFPEHTVRLAATFNNVVYNCWVVYTDNPGQDMGFDMPYIEHYVTTAGLYIAAVPANTFHTDNREVFDNDQYFAHLRTVELTKTVELADGTPKLLKIPVSLNENDGRFYLMDPTRKIAVAQFKDFYYDGEVVFVSSESLDGWSDNNLLAYSNYIKPYDFYAERGIRSVDGFGVPMLVTVGYCRADGTPEDNACYYGVNSGWASFAVSDINHYSDALDVCAHEFTHGVTRQSMQGTAYRNETGAINESYSDIMGNLCEMILGETDDRSWLIGEMCGSPMRNMGDPNACAQPAFVGDRYYVAPVMNPSYDYNDNGGVHGDNSLIGHMAYLLDQAGMSMDEQFSMWSTSIELLTPLSDYQDLHGILLFSLKINGMLKKYGPTLNQAFAEAGLNGDWNEDYLSALRPGCGRITFQTDGYVAGETAYTFIATTDGTIVDVFYPDRNGIASILMPAGSYLLQLHLPQEDGELVYNYDGERWMLDGALGGVNVTAGDTAWLSTLNTGRQPSGGGTGGGSSGGKGSEALNLITFNGGYFSLLMPEGWRIEVNGEYGSFSFKIFDPMNPSMQVFYYGALAPFHKSEASRTFLSAYDITGGLITYGPVLTDATVQGLTDCWQYCIDYQQRFSGKQFFTTLNDIQMLQATVYDGPNAGTNAIDSVGTALCTTGSGDTDVFLIATTFYDEDTQNRFGGNWFYTAFDTVGVLCPIEMFGDCYLDLLQCAASLRFSEDYIEASQSSDAPMSSNEIIGDCLDVITRAMDAVFLYVLSSAQAPASITAAAPKTGGDY